MIREFKKIIKTHLEKGELRSLEKEEISLKKETKIPLEKGDTGGLNND